MQCVHEGQDVKRIEKRISTHSLYVKGEKDLECKFVGNQNELIVGRNLLEFEATVSFLDLGFYKNKEIGWDFQRLNK